MAKKQLTIEEKLEAALVPVEEQPYKVPENWCWVRLDKLYQVNPKNEDVDEDTRAAFIPMANIDGGLTSNFTYEIQSWKQAKKGHTQMADGDVAFAKISPCFENRKSMIVEGLENGIGGGTTELIILRQPNVNKEYTFWLVSTEEFISKGCTTYSGTVGQQRISMDFVKNYPVPLAPLNEQSRIVARIESLFAKLDEAKEKIQEVLDGTDLRRAAILHQAFTGKLTEKWRSEHNIYFDSWEKKKLGDIGALERGRSKHRPRNDPKLFGGRYPFIQTGDIAAAGMYITTHKQTLSDIGFQQSRLFPAGTLCITIAANIGDVAILSYDCCFPDSVAGFNPHEGQVLSEYVYYLMTVIQQELEANAPATAQKNINLKVLNDVVVTVPTVPEQQEIVRLLDNLLSREQATVTACEEALTTIETLKKSILARAFRGELGTNDPAEPNAKELLKDILSA